MIKNPYGYAWEKHLSAMHSLVSSTTIHRRMISAISALTRLNSPTQLPPDIREEFFEFLTKMTDHPAIGGEGTIHSTVMNMSEEALDDAAEKIVEFFDHICRTMEPI